MLKLNKAVIRGSITLLLGINLYNLLNFILRWSMVRMLSVAQYGQLAALISIIVILTVFTESIQTILARYASLQSEEGMLKNIMKKTVRKALFVALIVFVFYIFLAIPGSALLKIPYSILFLNGLIIFPIFLVPITKGILQGRKRFAQLSYTLIIEGLIKLFLAVFLVYLGFKIYGSLISIILAISIAFLFSLFFLKDILKSEEKAAHTHQIYFYSLPVFIITFIIMTFISIDVLVSSTIFDEQTAGYYALASLIGQMIFMATSPISKAMFPISTEEANKGKSRNVALNASLLLIGVIIVALPFYYFMPNFLVTLFAGKLVPQSSSILLYTAIAFSILSLNNLVLLYKLSLGRIRRNWFILFLSSVAMLFIFIGFIIVLVKNHFLTLTLQQFALGFIVISTVLLALSLFLLKNHRVSQ